MKETVGVIILALVPFLIMIISFFLPTASYLPYLLLSVLIVLLALIFGSVRKWDDSTFKEKIVNILKVEAAITVFGISLGGLVLQAFSEITNVHLIVAILLLSSGFFVFSMILGVLYLLIGVEGKIKRCIGWAMIISLLYGLFALLIGWSFILKPVIETLSGL